MNDLVNGEMKNGFALIACPAKYGNSGVMTSSAYQKNEPLA